MKKILLSSAIFLIITILLTFIIPYTYLYKTIHIENDKKIILSQLQQKYKENFKIVSIRNIGNVCEGAEFSIECDHNAYEFLLDISPINNPEVIFSVEYKDKNKFNNYNDGLKENYIDVKKLKDIANEIQPIISKTTNEIKNITIDFESDDQCHALKKRDLNKFNNVNISNEKYLQDYFSERGGCYLTTTLTINTNLTKENLNEQIKLGHQISMDLKNLKHLSDFSIISLIYNNQIEMSISFDNSVSFYEKYSNGEYIQKSDKFETINLNDPQNKYLLK